MKEIGIIYYTRDKYRRADCLFRADEDDVPFRLQIFWYRRDSEQVVVTSTAASATCSSTGNPPFRDVWVKSTAPVLIRGVFPPAHLPAWFGMYRSAQYKGFLGTVSVKKKLTKEYEEELELYLVAFQL